MWTEETNPPPPLAAKCNTMLHKIKRKFTKKQMKTNSDMMMYIREDGKI